MKLTLEFSRGIFYGGCKSRSDLFFFFLLFFSRNSLRDNLVVSFVHDTLYMFIKLTRRAVTRVDTDRVIISLFAGTFVFLYLERYSQSYASLSVITGWMKILRNLISTVWVRKEFYPFDPWTLIQVMIRVWEQIPYALACVYKSFKRDRWNENSFFCTRSYSCV